MVEEEQRENPSYRKQVPGWGKRKARCFCKTICRKTQRYRFSCFRTPTHSARPTDQKQQARCYSRRFRFHIFVRGFRWRKLLARLYRVVVKQISPNIYWSWIYKSWTLAGLAFLFDTRRRFSACMPVFCFKKYNVIWFRVFKPLFFHHYSQSTLF